MSPTKSFELEMTVRDYECDLQGIVNNAVYLNYFEHTRHQFPQAIGLDFGELHREGTDPVVRRIEIDYKRSLKGGDRFLSSLQLEWRGRLQMLFRQSIRLTSDTEVMARADSYVVFITDGKPIARPQEVVRAVERWWQK